MLLTDLATAARKSGLPVIEVDGWRTRGHGHLSSVETIVCHHTAGPATGNYPSLGVVRDGRPGLAGPLAQLGLGRDGTVYIVAAGVAYHAGTVRDRTMDNWHSIGIEAEATGTSAWPEVQMDAYARLCRALCDRYDVPVARVLGHKEICAPAGRKIDPNFDMDAFRERVREAGDDMAQYADQLNRIERKIDAARERDKRRQQVLVKRLRAIIAEVKDDATRDQIKRVRADIAALADDLAADTEDA